MECAEGVLGDLEEEFSGRLVRSGHPASRRWYWRQAIRTTVHLVWGSVRTAPWSTTALVLASFVVSQLLYGVMVIWVQRLVGNLPIYDYDTAIWSWRVAALVKFVCALSVGWSVAVIARGREMVTTTLVAGLLSAILLFAVAISAYNLFSRFGPTATPALIRMVFETLRFGTGLPLGLVIGGMLRRMQRMRTARIAA
jgi:hypothetical protein